MVSAPITSPHARVKRHLAFQTTHPSEPIGVGNSSRCWRCSSSNTTSSMFEYVAAMVKQLREATILMTEKLRLQEVKCKQCSVAKKEAHDKKLKRLMIHIPLVDSRTFMIIDWPARVTGVYQPKSTTLTCVLVRMVELKPIHESPLRDQFPSRIAQYK